MMELICLANSYKVGGRCVAGISTANSELIRPISTFPGGTLSALHCTVAPGIQVKNLDVFTAEIVEARASIYHPEDKLIRMDVRWNRIGGSNTQQFNLLKDATSTFPDLLRGTSDRISCESITTSQPMGRSLQLIEPTNPRLVVTKNYSGNKQYRSLFRYGGHDYNLTITDDQFTPRYSTMEIGYNEPILVPEGSNLRYLISLSEPFNGMHYKLIAGVLVF